ncbi:MAG: peptide ligase PGM1-related protein [Actinomycetota bacterium]
MSDSQERFEALQRKLVPLWKTLSALNEEEQTIVVLPSINVDAPFLKGPLLQAYEERYLFLLLLLRQPKAHLVYVTSIDIEPDVIDYYLGLLPGVVPAHARRRLHLVPAGDDSARPLSEKILQQPAVIERLRSLVIDPDRAHLVPFNSTAAERDVALALGIPMYGADPKFLPLGTKSGARRLFREEGVPCPEGVEDVHSPDEVVEAVQRIRRRRPDAQEVLVKLNEGVSGMGNARVSLADLPPAGSAAAPTAIAERLRTMEPESSMVTLEDFLEGLRTTGGVVEERVTGREVRSPSVQMRATPLGELEVLSTHDQVLGGRSGQEYFGARFPADPEYAGPMTMEAERIGRRLVAEGVLGRFAMDFVVVRNDSGGWDTYAIELNLRKGGTTHPFLTLQFLTDGSYDPNTATFRSPSGGAKHFIASDHVESEAYRGLTSERLFDIALCHGLHFDQARQTGVVFHMLAALTPLGRFGLTAVADSAAAAQELYDRTVGVLEREASGR